MCQIRAFKLQLRGYLRDVKGVMKLNGCVVPELGVFLSRLHRVRNREAPYYSARITRQQRHKAEIRFSADNLHPTSSSRFLLC
jgi:hypothetical protein